ncbi:MAG: uncharacterized protein KVP18_004434 [Porospora cf. gigantea A]|nr:MAG: hypothetical protein KVP18_004434 [Porospora cf. gigantea A]
MPPKYDSCISSLEPLAEGEQSRRKRIASKFRSRKKKIDERGLVKSPTDDANRLWSSVRHSLNRRKSSGSSPRRVGSDGCSSARVAGCTAVVAVLTAGRLVVANAGDSRAFLGRSSGVVALSEDHKPNLPCEKLRIESGGGTVEFGRVNGNLNLSRAVGDLHYKQDTSRALEEQIITSLPDVASVTLSADDEFVFLGCDGLFEFFSNEDVYRFVAHRLVSDAISCRFAGVRSSDRCMIGLNAAVNNIIASMPLTQAHIVPAEIVIPDTAPLPSDATRVSCILERLLNAILSPNPTFVDYGCDNMTAVAVDLRPFRGCPCACHSKALPMCVGESTVV